MGKLVNTHYFDGWQGTADTLNGLIWNLSWREHHDQWHLWTGDQKLFIGDTEHELQAFLCGMALSLAVLPDSLLEQIRQIASE